MNSIGVKHVIYCLFGIMIFLSCQKEFQYPIITENVHDNFRTYECLNVKVTAIKCERGLVIIDTHRCPTIMAEIKKQIENDFEITDVLYVINTHGHWDHASGNQLFPDSILVGHENCPSFMRNNPANTVSNFWYTNKKLQELREGVGEVDDRATEIKIREIMLEDIKTNYRITPPSITFQDSIDLDCGDISITLLYGGNAHTNNDIIIYIPQLKTMITGDLFNTRSSYSFAMHKLNDIPRLIALLNRILNDESGIEYVIPSHTPVMTRDDLIAMKELLESDYRQFASKQSAANLLKELIEKHGIDKALNSYCQIEQKFNDNYYVMEEEFNSLGKQLHWEGKHGSAIKIFQQGLNEFPRSALLYDNLAEVFLETGQKDSAVFYYNKSLEIFPENRNASEILKAIQD